MRRIARRAHRCLASSHCENLIPYADWACRWHRSVLGDDLTRRINNAWRNRLWGEDEYRQAKAAALKRLQGIS